MFPLLTMPQSFISFFWRSLCAVLVLLVIGVYASPSHATLSLTEAEQAYLLNNPVIKIANDAHWEPFEYIDEDCQLAGMVADYVSLFEQKLGVKFDYVLNEPWAGLIDQVKSGERPVVMARHATEERKAYLNFTKSYISFPVVIVARESEEFINGPQVLKGHTIAAIKGFNATEYINKHHPDIAQLEVFSIQEGLRAVIANRAYAFVGNLGSINYAIKKHGLDGLKIIGQLPINADLAIGVHKNDPVLFTILQKTLADVSPAEHQAIYDKWFQLRAVRELNRHELWQIASYALGIFSLLLLFILWLRYQQTKQQQYINRINEYSYATLIDLETMTFIWCSRSYARLVGCSAQDLIGKPALELMGEAFPQDRLMLMQTMIQAGQTWSGECSGKGCGGALFWTILTLTPQKDWRGRVTQVWATRIDITDKKRIEQLSIVDELTGLYNRRQFNLIVEQEIRRAQRENHTLCLASMDIDFFKLINDVYGHQQGDEALKALAQVLKSHFNRANDYVFRMGGEEFMLLTSCECVEGFMAHMESLRKAVLNLHIPNESAPLHYMTISIGACYWQDLKLISNDIMYSQVDQALYRAKSEGRNRLVLCQNLLSGE